MTPETVLTLAREALLLTLMLAAPLLIASLAVGVLIGLFQAATQINEMTLSFIPKLLALTAVVVVAGPWMLQTLTEYTRRLFESIPSLIG
ncbi:MAG: flagellar biosynthesis protein FliQ [Stagnimonas sp.]|nr:flagellar biosynthesis protein FliQ [Stagnimonas sp.]